MKLKHLFMPLTGLALISLASPSYAIDYKVYPGAGCQPSVSGQAFRADATGFTNTSTKIESVLCPVVRDRLPATNLLDPGVRVASSNGALLVCLFKSRDQNGAFVGEVGQVTASNEAISLFFGPTISNVAEGNYLIECLLPPNGRVIYYILGEDGETSGITSGN